LIYSHHPPFPSFRANVLFPYHMPGPFIRVLVNLASCSPSRRVDLSISHPFHVTLLPFSHHPTLPCTQNMPLMKLRNPITLNENRQCAKRHLPCNYPLTSRRGQRKPHDCPDLDGAGASVSSPASSTSSGTSNGNGNGGTNGVSARACSKSRARASSKLSTTTTTSSLVTPA
jgi:hypothetical protein